MRTLAAGQRLIAARKLLTCQYGQAEENDLPVYVCTQPKVDPRDAWRSVKHFN